MPGPPPTPTDILKLHGSDLPDRKGARGRKQEPKPEKKAPPCPRRLPKEGKAVWKRAVEQLRAMNVLTVADGNTLERYCRMYVEEWELSEFVKKHGISYPLKDGEGKVKCFQQFPQVAQMNRVRGELLKIEVQFGLTPAGRARLEVESSPVEMGVKTRNRRKA